ncbi:hypothetical protein Gogos_019058 [Gossypium gossypioides]|uniref:Disease resistance R13L4/SHOC-2-like LRR domain-containing protein n=1 Tax=Gossypium gossypioides TaxID=34282 RepID=A0A7J9BGB1_GOSGO|nr:hypothetical protein [Gossypium gossypioides]
MLNRNKDSSKWVELKQLFAGGAVGSKNVVTTRSSQVAKITGTSTPLHLEALLYEKSLSLFLKFAFKKGEEKQRPNLINTGERIVKKCKRVPLVVKTLGSMLFSKTSEQEWKLVRDSETWELMEKDNETVSVLKPSYDQLSPPLKQCFAYCSLFPKDVVFYEVRLIAFWMAHDYDDISIFGTFKMHDLLHDLASFVAKNECCIVNSFEQNIVPGIRHVSLVNSDDSSDENASKFFKKIGYLRTLEFPICSKSFTEACLKRFQHLRMLDLSESNFEVLPEWIGNLKHSRKLNISNCPNIKKLPNSICELQKLQTLDFDGCEQIEELPKDMRHVVNLRFLSLTTKQRDLRATLQWLVIGSCEKLDLSTTQGFKEKEADDDIQDYLIHNGFSLQSLAILDLLKLEALPQWLLLVSANTLKNLTIRNCENLKTLAEWHNLTSFEIVEIKHCPEFSSLPKSMQCLKQLRIEDSPLLSLRCQQEMGVEWPKIAHASPIVLDGNSISAPHN